MTGAGAGRTGAVLGRTGGAAGRTGEEAGIHLPVLHPPDTLSSQRREQYQEGERISPWGRRIV